MPSGWASRQEYCAYINESCKIIFGFAHERPPPPQGQADCDGEPKQFMEIPIKPI